MPPKSRAFAYQRGTVLKTFFTNRPRARYPPAMLTLAAAVIAASAPAAAAPRPAGATVRATASVRIISGATIHWSQTSGELPPLRVIQLREVGGERQPIHLIEFE